MAGTLRKILKSLIGPTVLGAIDYLRFPERKNAWGGPFNGQRFRQKLFLALVDTIKPAAIVETGTYLGTTTEFLARTGIRTYTIEGEWRNYGYARARFLAHSRVTVYFGDSRNILRRLISDTLRPIAGKPIFIYLDAHWNDDLPLIEEIHIIFNAWAEAIVMIDDFQVQFDDGYSYDDYGLGKSLTHEYIAPALASHGLQAFYPSIPSANEDGLRRGCVVLAKAGLYGKTLAAVPLLRANVEIPRA